LLREEDFFFFLGSGLRLPPPLGRRRLKGGETFRQDEDGRRTEEVALLEPKETISRFSSG
jgi:hypothetical protein